MPENNARLTMRMTQVTSNQEPYHYTILRVEDATSGLLVAEFELSPKDVVDLIASRQVGDVEGLPAYLVEPEMRAALGCRSFNTSHHFPTSKYNDDTVDRWAKRTAGALGAAKWRTSKNNAGQIVVLFTYYTQVTTDARMEELRETRQATMDVAATACAADK